MLPTTRDRTDDLQALEELWSAPAYAEPKAPSRRVSLVPGALVAGGWLTFFVVAIAFQPPPEHGMTWPVWATTVSVVQLTLLLGAAAVGPLFHRVGFAAATLAGPLGIALAVNCRASEHHLGNWWLVELGATIALAVLAATGLFQRLRR
jgi:uncharacterized membrane protein AbrB (regulator of aidB expression)